MFGASYSDLGLSAPNETVPSPIVSNDVDEALEASWITSQCICVFSNTDYQDADRPNVKPQFRGVGCN